MRKAETYVEMCEILEDFKAIGDYSTVLRAHDMLYTMIFDRYLDTAGESQIKFRKELNRMIPEGERLARLADAQKTDNMVIELA